MQVTKLKTEKVSYINRQYVKIWIIYYFTLIYVGHVNSYNLISYILQVNLGVLKKNEQYEAEMIDLPEWVHQYVPGHSKGDNIASNPIKVLSGGDYLTFERNKEAQAVMQDARTPSTRLEGLVPKIENFLAQAEWTKVETLILVAG